MDSNSDGRDFDAAGLEQFLKTKEGLLNVIEQLRGRVSHRWSFETVKSYMKGLVNCHGVHQSHTITGAAGLLVHRVRHLERSDIPLRANELGAREPEKTSDYGRCHWPGNPLCYCSLYDDTALAEIRAERGQRYVIATYQVKEDLIVLPIGELDLLRRTGETQLGSDLPATREPYRRAAEGVDGNLKLLVDAFFADEFIKPANSPSDYKLTSALSDVLFDAAWASSLDAIHYPSVAFRAGSNFAIRPNAVEKKLKLLVDETKIVVVKDVLGYGIFETETEAALKSVSDLGELDWGPAPK